MNSLVVGLVIAASMFACGVAGMFIRKLAPDRHFPDNARELIKIVAGLTSTLSALVLSLLVASSYSLFTAQKTGLETLAARAIEINRMLVHYGPDAAPGREILKTALVQGYTHFWGEETAKAETLTLQKAVANASIQSFGAFLETLEPKTATKTRLVAKMSDLFGAVVEARDMMFMQLASPIAWQLLLVLTLWTSALFFGFGLLSEVCVTTLAAMGTGSVVLGGAIFLILDLSQPYTGMIRISPAALEQAIKLVGG